MVTVETTGGTCMVGCGATGLEGCGANAFAAAGLVQFSGDEITGPVSLMTSGGGAGGVAQPARNIAAAKMIPANLNTRQLCGTRNRTQAVSSSVLLALIRVLVLELSIFEDEGDEESIVCFLARLFVARNCGMIFRK